MHHLQPNNVLVNTPRALFNIVTTSAKVTTTLVNITMALDNSFAVHSDNTSVYSNGFMALANRIMVLINNTLRPQFGSQSSPRTFNSGSTVRSASSLIPYGDISASNFPFLKGTML
ncbi:uncharacterized protein LACBIDRAFT_329205 [Laccaria bicolor S238N-H82]|uniref:Predicted protein n=1 Tax=Laccaria bicolor (strain S238N-H82 / ATCC MYA-4686) TaxID=486041 RepID=B0DHD3_LACBS|nr:uncharacterized protein LACBIDRAFT_329204 [Laccaria bicolor S238N-H82]XP_001883284.1 uncharacterized protein LACBIDRAFT_329205 [Laccaria bicolor S238N-H82]EDR05995.1 predicted protein [Laccaria bicolor S238N-H82]EDR05996.1 predicted protein [Laccaria bicolor S238N-H82]|eukprot:XP_001883283.1 predicted protein [Laccaria bicolor S238N-H82]